jgi:glycosyltransferase involved in cell wall biosynthesis
LAKSGRGDIAVHILGKGDKRSELETLARKLGLRAIFHGFKPHHEAARYIGAADLCLAPYRQTFYRDGIFTSSTCKVPEYLACGRIVLTIPCARMSFLTREGAYGFLVEDDPDAYARFFGERFSGAEISRMEQQLAHDLESGALAATNRVLGWDAIASRLRPILAPLPERPAPDRAQVPALLLN